MEASANAASNAGCAPVALDGGALITVVRLIANPLAGASGATRDRYRCGRSDGALPSTGKAHLGEDVEGLIDGERPPELAAAIRQKIGWLRQQ